MMAVLIALARLPWARQQN